MTKFKQIFLAIAIAVVFVFFVGIGIDTFYKEPEFEDFCEEKLFEPFPRALKIPEECAFVQPSEELKKECTEKEGEIRQKFDDEGCVESYSCETCNKEYRDVLDVYNRNVFIIAVIIGIVTLIVGLTLQIPSASSGLMGGGILSIVYGIIRYWSALHDYGRFIILGIALGVLIWLGYKKLGK